MTQTNKRTRTTITFNARRLPSSRHTFDKYLTTTTSRWNLRLVLLFFWPWTDSVIADSALGKWTKCQINFSNLKNRSLYICLGWVAISVVKVGVHSITHNIQIFEDETSIIGYLQVPFLFGVRECRIRISLVARIIEKFKRFVVSFCNFFLRELL